MWTFWFLLGLVLGILFVALARVLGERRILSVGLVVATVIYVGFAIFGNADRSWLGIEALGVVLYGSFAMLSLRYTEWWLALGWAVHPIWDIALHLFGGGSLFAPAWYAIQCISFDVVVALYIAFRCLRSGHNNSIKL
jgi:hypothetical protein